MSFSAATVVDQTRQSVNAILLLNSSCQAMIEASIDPVASDWYQKLNGLLGDAESLVVGWRQGGYLYFYDDSVQAIVAAGHAFLDAEQTVDGLFESLAHDRSAANRNALVTALDALGRPIQSLTQSIDAYKKALGSFDDSVQTVMDRMSTTVQEIQAQAARIHDEIQSINARIANLRKQIRADRQAIAKAKSARKEGIAETIFGIVLAPFTAGASLVLAGIGVATIAEAEDKVKSMQQTISSEQKAIAGDQRTMAQDEKEISALDGLVMSARLMIDDMGFIVESLDPLRVSWSVLADELGQTVQKLEKAETAHEVLVGRAWFDAVCREMQIIVSQAGALSNRQIDSRKVRVG